MGTPTPAMKSFLLLALFLSIAVHLTHQQPGGRRRRGLAEVLDRRLDSKKEVMEAEKMVANHHGAAVELENHAEDLDRRARHGRRHHRLNPRHPRYLTYLTG